VAAAQITRGPVWAWVAGSVLWKLWSSSSTGMLGFLVALIVLFSLFNLIIVGYCVGGIAKIFKVRTKGGRSPEDELKELHLNIVHALGNPANFVKYKQTADVRAHYLPVLSLPCCHPAY
jgi:hypothetical protein